MIPKPLPEIPGLKASGKRWAKFWGQMADVFRTIDDAPMTLHWDATGTPRLEGGTPEAQAEFTRVATHAGRAKLLWDARGKK